MAEALVARGDHANMINISNKGTNLHCTPSPLTCSGRQELMARFSNAQEGLTGTQIESLLYPQSDP